MSDSMYPLFPVVTLLGFILSLIPLPWHLQAWNSGTCYFMMWTALACINQFVNSVVWHGNTTNFAPIWCEISIRIMMGASVGIPAASLCINRRLYHIASAQTVTIGIAEKRRAIIIDSLIALLFPLVYIAIQFVVQGHRFNILEDIGCFPAIYNTPLTFVLTNMWPLLIGCISAIYCVLTLRAFARRRLEFSRFMNSNSASLTMGRYFRLMALATTELFITIPLSIFMIWLNATAAPIAPWISWADTHYNYSRIDRIPAVFWRQNHLSVVAMDFNRWVVPACALVFFAFFGFADEAKRNYKKAFFFITKPLGLQQSKPSSHKGIVTIGQFAKPRSPMSEKSFNSTAKLPLYSPPPTASTYDTASVKRTESFASSTFSVSVMSTQTIPDSPTSTTDLRHTAALSPRQLAWLQPISPYQDRRHSSLA